MWITIATRGALVFAVLNWLHSYGHEVQNTTAGAECISRYLAKLEITEKAHQRRQLQDSPVHSNIEDTFYKRLYGNAQLMRTVLFENSLQFSTKQHTVLDMQMAIKESTQSHTAEWVVDEINKGEYYLKDVQKRNLVKDGSTILDLGTNVGITAITMAKMFPNAKVIGVEPMPPNFACALENVEKNNVAERVTVLNAALSADTSKTIAITYSGPNSGGSSFSPEFGEGGYRHEFAIHPITVEEILNHFGVTHVSFVKLDCEGCEFDIVPAFSQRVLDLFADALVMGEIHDSRMTISSDRLRFVSGIYDAHEGGGTTTKVWNPDVKKARMTPFHAENSYTPKEGDLVKLRGNAVFLIKDGMRHEFQSKHAFVSRGYDFENIHVVDSLTMMKFPMGDPLA